MLNTFLLALGLVLFLVAAMSIGVIFGRKPISGSCGGVGGQIGGSCSVCGRSSGSCEDDEDEDFEEQQARSAELTYNAAEDAGQPPRRDH